MHRFATIALFASVFASACAVPGADIDVVQSDLQAALAVGDYQLALDIGSDFVGMPVNAIEEPEGTPMDRPDGFIAATFTPDERLISAADLLGAFTSINGETTREFSGARLAPVEDQLQGELYATSVKEGGEEDGEVQGTFRASPSAEMGGIHGIWTSDSMQRPLEFQGVYTETAENEGQAFGTYRVIQAPVWTEQLRLRVYADGLAMVEITPEAVTILNIMGVAPGQTGTDDGKEAKPTFINEEAWMPSWPEEGGNPDCNCYSSSLASGDRGLFAPEAEADVVLHRSLARGYVNVVEEPTSENGFLTRVLINDTNYAGGAWYQMDLAFKQQ